MPIEKRVVVHFSGFEPLSAEDHYSRYQRSAAQAGKVWDTSFSVLPLEGQAFSVVGEGRGGPPKAASTSFTTIA